MNNWQQVPATNSGYVQDADVDGLLEFATANRLLIRMRRGIGQFAGTGSALVEVAADTESGQIDVPMGKEEAERISGFFSLARHRTIEQDVGFGIRQIVDIALKALSPGINDTTTAINCLDKLGEITGSLARRTMPARIRSHEGLPRVITIAPTFQEFVETAFDQIRVSGKANAAIFERMLTTLFYVAERCQSQSRRAVIETQIELVAQFADQSLSTEYEKGRISDRVRDLRKASRL